MSRIEHELLRPIGLCFEIGAHEGRATRDLARSAGRVVAVEPQPERAAELRRAFEGSGRVIVIEAAAGPRQGRDRLFVCRDADAISTMSDEFRQRSRFAVRGYTWDEALDVDVVTLDQLIARFGRPDFCTIDVEGFEPSVLRGLSCPVRLLAFEYHEESPAATRECLELLERISPIGCNVCLGDGEAFALPRWLPPAELMDRLPTLGACDWGQWGRIYVRMLL